MSDDENTDVTTASAALLQLSRNHFKVKRRNRAQQLWRAVNCARVELEPYWKYRLMNDWINQDAGKHIPPSGLRRVCAQRNDSTDLTKALLKWAESMFTLSVKESELYDDKGNLHTSSEILSQHLYDMASLRGDAEFRTKHATVLQRFPTRAEHQKQLRVAVNQLRERLPGFGTLQETERCRLYDPFAGHCYIPMYWRGFKNAQAYAREFGDGTHTSDTDWIAAELVYGNCVKNDKVKKALEEDAHMEYHRVLNSLDPVAGIKVFDDSKRDGYTSINIITSPPFDLNDAALFFFSKRCSQFAAFLVQASFFETKQGRAWTQAREVWWQSMLKQKRVAVIPKVAPFNSPFQKEKYLQWVIIFKSKEWRSKLMKRAKEFYLPRPKMGGRREGAGRPPYIANLV